LEIKTSIPRIPHHLEIPQCLGQTLKSVRELLEFLFIHIVYATSQCCRIESGLFALSDHGDEIVSVLEIYKQQ